MYRHIKIKTITRLIATAKGLVDRTAGDADFIAWREATRLALSKIYGTDSLQYDAFAKKAFTVTGSMRTVHDADKARRRLAVYNRDLEVSIKALEEYLEEAKEEDPFKFMGMTLVEESHEAAPMPQTSKKVFISHASANKDIVGELIEILKQVGLRHGQIFCTSFPEYSIPLGVNYLDWLKKELTENSLVIFVLSHEFYKSPVCLSEMGATWALSKEHVPIFVPPFTYDESKGPFPLSQGMIVTEKFKYNELANMVERLFELPARGGDWERSRDTIITRIEHLVQAGIEAIKAKEQADAEEQARPLKELSEIIRKSQVKLASQDGTQQTGIQPSRH